MTSICDAYGAEYPSFVGGCGLDSLDGDEGDGGVGVHVWDWAVSTEGERVGIACTWMESKDLTAEYLC